MSRNLLASAVTYLADARQVKIAHLVRIELAEGTAEAPVYLYITDYANNVVWDNKTYEAGKITKVGSLRQTQGLTNYKLSVDIAGEFQEELDRGLVDHNNKSYVGRQIEVLRAYLDEAGAIIPFDKTTNGPMQYFIGDVSSINISEGVTSGNSTVTWECAGKFQDFELVNGRVTDDSAHRGLVSLEDGAQVASTGAKKEIYKTDTGFQHANQTIDVITQYTTLETRYRNKSSWLGFRNKTVEYQEEVQNTLELGVDLAANALPKVYGVRRVPGIPVFLDVLKGQPILYIVYAFCEGEVDSVLNFYNEEAPLICSSASDADNRVCLGNQANGDTLSAYSSAAAAQELINVDSGYSPFSIYDREVSSYREPIINLINPSDAGRSRTEGTRHGEAFTITNDAGRSWVKVFHGSSTQAACPELVALAASGSFSLQEAWARREYGDTDWAANQHKYWDENSKLLDTCYAVLQIELGENTTVPTLEAVVSGTLISTYTAGLSEVPNQYTLNPVWQTLNYITDPVSGGGLDINLVDLQSFKDVADYYDQVTTTYDDSFVSYWRYIGWKDAPGTNTTTIDATAHDLQKTRMQTNVVVRTENTVTKNIQAMLSQFDGTLNILGSKYHLSIEGNDTPIADISSDDVIGSIKTKDLSNKNKWNSIKAAIINPAQGWGTTQINFFNSAFLAADNGVAKKGNVVFNHITNYYTAREWAQVQLAKSRYSREISFTTYYKYSYLFPNANVRFTYPRFGYANTVFRVKSCVLQPTGLVELTLEDYDESIFTGVSSNDISGEVTNKVPNILPPTGVEFVSLPSARFANLTAANYPDVNGFLLWDVADSSNTLRYDVQDWLKSTSDYAVDLSQKITDNNGLTKHFIPVSDLSPALDYTFKVRAISLKGSASKWGIVTKLATSIGEVQFSPIRNFVGTNTYGTQSFFGSSLDMTWDIHSNPNVTAHEIQVWDSTETTLLRTEILGIGVSSYSYTLAKNKADYSTHTGGVGAYREVVVYAQASNDPTVPRIISERTELT